MIIFFVLSAISGFSFSIAIPESMQDKTEEEIQQWINEQMREGHEVQKKVAKERYDRRIEERQEVAASMKSEALKRRNIVRQTAIAREKRREQVDAKTRNAQVAIAFIFFPVIGILIYTWYKSRHVEIPETATDHIKANLATSQSLMHKLKKREDENQENK